MRKVVSLTLLVFAVSACGMSDKGTQQTDTGPALTYILVMDDMERPVSYKLVEDKYDRFSCNVEKVAYTNKSIDITERFIEPERCAPGFRMTEDFKRKIIDAYDEFSDFEFDPKSLNGKCVFPGGGVRGDVLEMHCGSGADSNRSAIIVTKFTARRNNECRIESKMLFASGSGNAERMDRSCRMAAEMLKSEREKTRTFSSVTEIWDLLRKNFKFDQ
ncbi:MAG: hypothetical protein FWF97_04340 [Alphaproteobacteria bacterium]|nr:hypothetical protein [Alphaproteobacteria bacterium]